MAGLLSGRCPPAAVPRRAFSQKAPTTLARQQRRLALRVAAVASMGVDTVRTVSTDSIGEQELKQLLARPRIDFTSIFGTVRVLFWFAEPCSH